MSTSPASATPAAAPTAVAPSAPGTTAAEAPSPSARAARWAAAAAELDATRDLWPDAVPREYTDPDPSAGLDDYLRRWATERPDTVAVHFYGTDITYAELDRQVGAFAGWLRAQGVQAGDRVGVYLTNCPQFTVAFLGILRIGAVHVPINPMFKSAELAYELADAGVSVLLAHPEFAATIDRAREELAAGTTPTLRTVAYTQTADVLAGPATPRAPFGPVDPELPTDWADIMAHAPADPVPTDPAALAALNYTGGTTGMPKGCEHTQGHMVYTARSAIYGQGRTPGDGGEVILGFLPMFWIAGEVLCLLNPIIDGSTLVLMNRWHPEQALDLMEARGITSMVAPADNYVEIMELPGYADADLGSLTMCTAVSFVRKLDTDLRVQWREKTGVTLREASYGMTETNTVDTFTLGLDLDDQDLRAEPTYCGYPAPGTDIIVVDADLEPVPAGQPGQILVRSLSVLRAYFGKPEATADSLVDGWLLTGDTGRFDSHGALTYLARTKEMIKVNGMSVFPSEVESFFKGHPDIVRIAVAPREDPEVGQRPVAFIERAPGATTTPAEFVAWAKDRMATYKVPEVVLVDAMPMTATGKIRKVALVEELTQS
ncbi:AMP-binding protein [Brevibacterium litoralis]|uniref:AMP-binding protein n=1 Tax=Brevibacterium litoralis TaxID=3138935 RepID=UPI0032F01943